MQFSASDDSFGEVESIVLDDRNGNVVQ